MLVLIGVAVLAAGLMLRFNPLAVVLAAALATGWAAGLTPLAIVAAFGKAFNDSRYITIIYLVLPVIGLLERYGLQARARTLVGRFRRLTVGRVLCCYLFFRQISSALGLISIAGHAQTVRPLVAPMAEAAASAQAGEAELVPEEAEHIRALAAATDNVGMFFGEDIFLAIGSILLMVGILRGQGFQVEPYQLSIWAIPTAIAAFLIHGVRLLLLDRRWQRRQ
jgi:uncharacterized membrane protein